MLKLVGNTFGFFADTIRDLTPILLVIGFFQFAVLRQPIDNLGDILIGFVFVLIGLTIFIRGLEMALFPLGEGLANAFAGKGSYFGCYCLPLAWVLALRLPNLP